MARRVVETLTDDIDGGEAAETITFALDGHEYSIDLSEKNAAKLRNSLAGYIDHAQRLNTTRTSARREAPSATSPAPAIRAWAANNGIELPARGRLTNTVRESYESRDVAALKAWAAGRQD